MKVIDLLNKIANGEEVPEKIKYKDKIYTFYGQEYRTDIGIIGTHTLLYDILSGSGNWYITLLLNEEVEIIEDKEDINIQPIEMLNYEKYGFDNKDEFGVDLVFKINEIIKQQDELVQAVKHLEKTKEDK